MNRGVLLGVLHVWLRCLLLVRADEEGFCLRSISLPPRGGFEQASRRMPPRAPALAAFDWDMATSADQQQLVGNYTPCHASAPIFRYKVAKGVIYVDHKDDDSRYKSYRDGFLEQLVMAMWLFTDFPDVDLVVDFTDHPQLCHQRIPFLCFSIFNASNLGSLVQQQRYNMTELLAPGWVTQEYVKLLTEHAAVHTSSQTAARDQQALQVLPYTRGFTIPTPEAWRSLSLAPVQLRQYTKCLQETHPWGSKRHVIFWRGQATGCSRGWPQYVGALGSAIGSTRQPHLLRNKRIQMALRLFPYPEAFDVGITAIPEPTPECLGASSQGGKHRLLFDSGDAGQLTGLDQNGQGGVDVESIGVHNHPVMLARAYRSLGYLLHKKALGMEGWADAVATLSMDGYGPAYRLPQQLLLPAVVLKQASPYQTWMDWELQPGVHYDQFAYDLSDLESTGRQLLAAGHIGRDSVGTPEGTGQLVQAVTSLIDHRKQMADAACTAVTGKVDIMAQLDAFAWSVARYKEVTPWEVEVPAVNDAIWHVLQVDPSTVFGSKGVAEDIRMELMQHMKQNFEVALNHPAYASHATAVAAAAAVLAPGTAAAAAAAG